MLPLMLDLTRLRLALIGAGEPALKRLERLDDAGAVELALYSPDATAELTAAAGSRLTPRLPNDAELARAQIVFIAGLESGLRDRLATRARACGAIVHAEDAPAITDSHAAAVLRRGDLTVAIGTGGKSPALAAEVKRRLENLLGEEWATLLDEVAAKRREWRAAGLSPDEIAQRTRNLIIAAAGPA